MALKIPYVRPAAPKTTIPKKTTTTVPNAWSGGAWSAPKAKATKKPAAKPFDPYAGLMLKEADPSTFQGTADAGYAADVAHGTDLANMGMPTNDSLTAAAAARAKGLGDISAALQAHIGQIQQAEVAQGNTVAGQLGAHAAATPTIMGAPAPTADAAVPAAQATLAGQTAGTGNLLGAIQAASAQGGAYAQGQAINQGAADVQQNDQNRAKAVASFLSGIATPAARVAGLVSDNEKVAAANAATKLSVWNTLQSQIEQDKLSGDKVQMAKDQLKEKAWEAGQSNQTKTAIARATISGANDRTAATIAGQNGRSDADRRAKVWQTEQTNKTNAAIAKLKAGATVTAADIRAASAGKNKTGPKHVKISYHDPGGPSSLDSNGNPVSIRPPGDKVATVTIQQWQNFLKRPLGSRKLSILGLPDGTSPATRAAIHYGDGISLY